jgi:serine/threonine protein phosphatase PrpC
MKYQVSQHSMRGARPTNQDRVAVTERENAVLMVLADGLGGHSGGELAAEILSQTAVRMFQAVRQPVITKPSSFLALIIMHAHKTITDVGMAHRPPITPRTTGVLCLVQNGYAYWAHVGDSRFYLFRGNQIVKRTRDHTFAEHLRSGGLLKDDEVSDHPDKSRLLKCIGGPFNPTITLSDETLLFPGDILLLCSDGLWEALKTPELLKFLQFDSLDEGIEEMLLAAEHKMKGTSDNLSAISMRWKDRLTTDLPLQAVSAHEATQQSLWDDAARMLVAQQPPATPTAAAIEPAPEPLKQSFDKTLKELEEFIKRFEGKL